MPDVASPRELPLSEPSLRVLEELGFHTLTPIQARALPLLLAGRDVLGQAPTGTGKTLAFALPLLERIADDRRPGALVLGPTRELCGQIVAEVRRLARHRPGIRVLALTGGAPFGPQVGSLERGAHVVVGTPGRTLDHLRRGTLRLDDVGFVVLDEADRMLDLGFQDDVEAILSALPEDRQTACFSATFPPAIEAIGRRWLRDPARVSVTAEVAIRQVLHEAEAPVGVLLAVLDRERPASALVFCARKAEAAELAGALRAAGVDASALHGDLDQRDRDEVLATFRNGSVRVLVATDVAARGLDIDDLPLVASIGLTDPETWVHRIGRTGRAGREGLAVAIARPGDRRIASLGLVPEPSPGPIARLELSSARSTLRIGGGRRDKLRPGDVLGALTGEAGLSAEDVGRIEILDRVAYVAVRRERAAAAARALDRGRIKNRRFRVDLV